MWRSGVELQHRRVRQEWNLVEARHRRDRCASPDVEEDAIGGEDLIPDSDFAGRSQSGMSRVDVAVRQAAQHLLDAAARSFRDRVLPGFDALHVDAHVAVDGHAEVACATRQMGGVCAGHHRFGWNASGVDARAAEQMPLDDGHRHAGVRQSLRESRSSLAGADDDRVVVLAHQSSVLRLRSSSTRVLINA